MQKEFTKALGEFFSLLHKIDRRLKRLEELEEARAKPSSNQSRLIPLAKWNDYHDYPTIPSLRFIALHRHKNGANGFFRKVGKQLYICEKSFFEWVNSKNKP